MIRSYLFFIPYISPSSFFLDTGSSLYTQTLAATMDSLQELVGVDEE
jgi:hypothetical protein